MLSLHFAHLGPGSRWNSRALCIAALLTLMAAPDVAGAEFQGIYARGWDRPGGSYATLRNETLDGCMDACRQGGNSCLAFSHDLRTNTCRLKHTLYPKQRKNGVASAAKTSAFRYVNAEQNGNRPGGDYKNFPLADANPALCAEVCQDENQCLAYTYVPPRNGRKAHCWLKRSKPAKKTASGMVSGVKTSYSNRRNAMTTKKDSRRFGPFFASYQMVTDDPNACRALCGTLASCEAWSFDPYARGARNPGGQCFLHPEEGNETSFSGWYSGERKKTYTLPRHPAARVVARLKDPDFNEPKFVTILRQKLNRFQGYGLIAIDPQGNEVAVIEDGYRIHPMTGQTPRRFTVDTPTRIGSISKAIAAVAVLHRERFQRGFLKTWLGTQLPYRWRREINPTFSTATFESLLEHESGIPNCCGSLRSVLEGEATSGGAGTFTYSNYGVETFNLTMGYALYGSFMQLFESAYASQSDSSYDTNIRDVTSSLYRSTLDQIFSKADVDVACRTRDTVNPSYFYTANFKNYSRIDDQSPGISNLDHHCAQGALVMSTRDLARLFHKVVNTDEIITDREREYLLTPDGDKRIGLFAGPTSTTGNSVLTHNGAHPGNPVYSVWDGPLNSHSELLIFQDGYIVAFNANSPQREGESAKDDIVAAWNEAYIGTPPALFP